MYALTVKDFMSSPVRTLPKDSSAYDAIKIMDRYNIGSVVIVDGKLVKGIVTERDILRRIVAKNLNMISTPLERIMTKDVISVPPNTTILELSNIMHQHHFRHVVILSNKKLVGIVSAKDLITVTSADSASVKHFVSKLLRKKGSPRKAKR